MKLAPKDYKVVLVPVVFTRGGFPSELVFEVETTHGPMKGVADREYCQDLSGENLVVELERGQQTRGRVIGVCIEVENKNGSGRTRVNLPDDENYELDKGMLTWVQK